MIVKYLIIIIFLNMELTPIALHWMLTWLQGFAPIQTQKIRQSAFPIHPKGAGSGLGFMQTSQDFQQKTK